MKLSAIKSVGIALVLLLSCNLSAQQRTVQEVEEFEEILWPLKAIRSTSGLIKIKAINENGRQFDVHAIQNSEQTSLLDVKAFVRGKRLPIKMLVSNDKFHPVKAIGENGKIYDIKAVTDDGLILPVKGVSQSGNIVHIRAIFEDMIFYNIIAISPEGNTNAVKGMKMSSNTVETTINGIPIFAHIKSIPQ